MTSGGMECIALLCQALIDPGDAVAVEAPTYLGALMAFAGAEADGAGIAMDDGRARRRRARRAARGRAAARSSSTSSPSTRTRPGRTLPLGAARALVELCRRHGVLIVEDVAYRELSFDGASLPSLWSLGPDVVLQAGHVLEDLLPRRAARLGGRPGASVVAELAAAKQNTDQCAGGLGQRLVEEYGRAGDFERHLPAARALYASHWAALSAALERHMPAGVRLDRADRRLPHLADAAGRPRHAGPAPRRARRPAWPTCPGRRSTSATPARTTLRLSFSHLGPPDLERAAERLGGVVGRRADARAGIAATRPGYRVNAGLPATNRRTRRTTWAESASAGSW